MRGFAQGVLVVCAAALPGCESDTQTPATPAIAAPGNPSEAEERTISTLLTLSHRELGSPGEVVCERRQRCRVALRGHRLRLLQAWPETARVRSGDGAWEPIAASASGEDADPGQGLMRAWLPATRAEVGMRQTRSVDMNLLGQPMAIEHVLEVTRASPGKLLLTMRARGGGRFQEADVSVTVRGEGLALLRDERVQWPERIEVCYRVLASGGAGPDAESCVRFALTLDEEPRS